MMILTLTSDWMVPAEIILIILMMRINGNVLISTWKIKRTAMMNSITTQKRKNLSASMRKQKQKICMLGRRTP